MTRTKVVHPVAENRTGAFHRERSSRKGWSCASSIHPKLCGRHKSHERLVAVSRAPSWVMEVMVERIKAPTCPPYCGSSHA